MAYLSAVKVSHQLDWYLVAAGTSVVSGDSRGAPEHIQRQDITVAELKYT